MRLLDYGQNKQYMDEIKRNINNVVPFFGVGVSMPYGYPSWSGLLLKVLDSIHRVTDMSEETYKKIKNYIDRDHHYMKATDEMYKRWPNLEDYVCYTISIIKPSSYSCLEKYIYLFPSQLYLTTNYDIVVENILRSYFNLNIEIVTNPTTSIGLKSGKESIRKEPTLCYLHGRYTDSSSIVFSEMDYNDFYGSSEVANVKVINRRPLARKLQEVYLRDPLLFLGCSMNMEEDRLLKLLKGFGIIGQQPQSFNYALLDGKDLTTDEIGKKEEKLLSIKVHPIWYFSVNDIDHEEAKTELFEYILGDKREEHEAKIKKQREEYEIEQKKQEEKKEEHKKLIKEIDESSEIKKTFPYPQKYYLIDDNYEFTLIKVTGNNRYYLSDQGRTFIMLDKVFELKEPDVLKNLNAIAKECEVDFIGGKLMVFLESWDNLSDDKQTQLLEEAKCKLFTCVSFMDKMRIFYV
jgi:hypothetical protein